METKMGHRNSRSRVAQTRTLTKKRHRQNAFGPHEKKIERALVIQNAQGKKSDFLLTFVPGGKSPGLETVEVSADKETRPVKHVLLECRLYNRMRRGLRTEESNKVFGPRAADGPCAKKAAIFMKETGLTWLVPLTYHLHLNWEKSTGRSFFCN